ncbi:SIMPL domain-containing protein [Sphaerisporangium sp. B11E5]|uniref:SIMPL domain-containing protein n=1 Tax=Sphaerisporangium sp. B11E5 TaxID=3153563 RepID=UPI00325C49FF
MTKLSVVLAATAFAVAGLQTAPALAAASPVPVAVTASRAAGDAMEITVAGQGSVQAVPDVMRLNVGVEIRRDTAGEAFAAARAAAGRLTAALVAAGVAEKDLRTNDLSLGTEYEKYPKAVGYRASQGMQAFVRDLSIADAVVDAAAGVGDEVRFHGVTFEVSKAAELLRKARAAAFEDARAKAEQYAALAGYRLGRVLKIEEEGDGGPPRFALAADKASSIEPGQGGVSVAVRVLYELTEAGPQDGPHPREQARP